MPAFNERRRLERTLREAFDEMYRRGERWEIIVVDDGSTDVTSAIVVRLSTMFPDLRLIRLPVNRGKGYAVRAGVLDARGKLVLVADAHGATPIAELERLERALAEGADIAIGSRAVPGAGVGLDAKLHRLVMGRTFNYLVSTLALRGFYDTQCGFKLFRQPVARELFAHLLVPGYGFDVEVLVRAQRRGCTVIEVPVNWNHKQGSRLHLVRDSYRMLRDLLVIRGNARRGKYDPAVVAAAPETADGSRRSLAG